MLDQLGDELSKAGTYATIDVYGGVAMALAFWDGAASYDVDVVLNTQNHQAFWDITEIIAKKNGLPKEWVNEGVLPVVQEDLNNQSLWSFGQYGGLTVRLPAAEQLLAMKVFSARLEKADLTHAAVLCRRLGIDAPAEIYGILHAYVKEDAIKKQNRRKGRHNCIHNFVAELVKELQ